MRSFYVKTIFAILCIFSFQNSGITQSGLFDKYPFLVTEFPNCNDIILLEYDQGPFAFVYASDGRLFFQDGTFYCQDSETRDCRALYNLTDITAESGCPDSDDVGDATQSLPIDEYPWMAQLVSEFDCASLTVQQYEVSVFSFFYFVDDTQSRLFFQDGTPYCTATPTFDCLEIYGLSSDNLVNEWACQGETSTTEAGAISGRITDTRGFPIAGAVVSIIDGAFANTSAITDSEGLYKLNLDGEPSSSVLSVSYTAGNECMNVFDLAITRAYILGIFADGEGLGSLPASVFAMDFSGAEFIDGVKESIIEGVSTLDIVLMQSVLTDIDSDNNLWRFYPENSALVDGSRYQVDRFAIVDSSTDNANFVGFQLGDIDDCSSYDRTVRSGFRIIENELESTDVQKCFDLFSVAPYLTSAIEITFQSDPKNAILSSFSTDIFEDADFSNFSETNDEGEVKFVWMSNNNITDGVFFEQGVTIMTFCAQLQSTETVSADIIIKDVGIVTPEFEYIGIPDDRTSFEFAGSDSAFAPDFIASYPWAESTLNCDEVSTITEYTSGIFRFLYVEPAGELYFQDGTFYCQEAESFNCRQIYELTQQTNQWSCDGAGFKEESIARLKSISQSTDLRVFPNPVRDVITVSISESINQVSVYNSSGQLVKQIRESNGGVLQIDLQHVESGMYVLKVETDSNTFIERIIKSSYIR